MENKIIIFICIAWLCAFAYAMFSVAKDCLVYVLKTEIVCMYCNSTYVLKEKRKEGRGPYNHNEITYYKEWEILATGNNKKPCRYCRNAIKKINSVSI